LYRTILYMYRTVSYLYRIILYLYRIVLYMYGIVLEHPETVLEPSRTVPAKAGMAENQPPFPEIKRIRVTSASPAYICIAYISPPSRRLYTQFVYIAPNLKPHTPAARDPPARK
jgi:hypothetical protein